MAIINYSRNEDWAAQYKMFGYTFVISRSSALMIHINTVMVLIPVCRNLLTQLRSTRLSQILSFDLSIEFHKFVGWSIVFFSLIHTAGHYRNYYILAKTAAATQTDMSVTRLFFKLLVTSGPSWTGHIMLLCLLFIAIPATERFKRKNFNRFYYLHHLFFVFFLFFSIHGAFCLLKPSKPPFCRRGAVFWKYYLASGLIYLLERILRELRGTKLEKKISGSMESFVGKITKVILHPSSVIEIQMQKDLSVELKAGQYIFLNCPAISINEWHPFTLTSAPEEDFYSVHLRVSGDWTSKLAYSLGIDELSTEFEKNDQPVLRQSIKHMSYSSHHLVSGKNNKPHSNRKSLMLKLKNYTLPRLLVDGPFGCASEEVFCHEVAILFGAGIGVTPFASVLKSIWYRHNSPGHISSLQKVYFIWTQRETESFEWFQDLLLAIEEEEILEFSSSNAQPTSVSPYASANLIEFQIYLTKKFTSNQVGNVMINDSEGFQDVITNLKSPTYYGRPNLPSIFGSVAERHPGSDVGVFFCGPNNMGVEIEKCIKNWTKDNPESYSTRFTYKKENF
ncbi:hypothetical protein BB558_003074 [Smittium angustum]|nr:hypothetical protein BB558_003074 [Smittium angustum]